MEAHVLLLGVNAGQRMYFMKAELFQRPKRFNWASEKLC